MDGDTIELKKRQRPTRGKDNKGFGGLPVSLLWLNLG